LRSDWIRAWLIASLNTHTFAPNGVAAVPGHTLGVCALETSAELVTDSDLGSGAPTGTAPTAVTNATANAATAAVIVLIAAVRLMTTRPATDVLLGPCPAQGDLGADGG
jgi:hypothetical protein